VTLPTELLGQSGLLFSSFGASAFFAIEMSPGGTLRRELDAYGDRLQKDLKFLRSPLRGELVVLLQLCSSFALVVAAVLIGSPRPLVLLVPIVACPGLVIRRKRLLRVQRIEEALDRWLLSLSNALKASTSLGEAIASTAKLCESPFREELETVLREHGLGTPLDDALEYMGARVESRVLAGAVAALSIARNAGGNLSRTLESAASALRDIARLEGVVRSKTAEGKAQALVVSVVPVPLVLGIDAAAPEFFAPLAGSSVGQLVMAGALAFWLAAVALAAKITSVDV
jgi:tight adherence protein B